MAVKNNPNELFIRCLLKAMDALCPFGDYRPRLEKIEDLCADILKNDPFRKRTLGGVVFERDDEGQTLFLTVEHDTA
jgi:hypothetical protein